MTNTRDDAAVLRAIAQEMPLMLLLDEVRARGYAVVRDRLPVCSPPLADDDYAPERVPFDNDDYRPGRKERG